jgi:hypothetical protein
VRTTTTTTTTTTPSTTTTTGLLLVPCPVSRASRVVHGGGAVMT